MALSRAIHLKNVNNSDASDDDTEKDEDDSEGGMLVAVFRIRIRTDPHKEMPPGFVSGSAWTDADPDPDPGGKKA